MPIALCLHVTLLLAVACGYHVVRYGDLPGAARSVSVRTLQNDSTEPGVELLVSEALRREVLRRGGLRLVADPDDADIVIGGRVRPIQTTSKSFSSVILALEHTLTLSVDLEVERRGGEVIDLSRAPLRETEIYLASADVEVGRKNRQEALRRLSGLIAGRVHDALDREL